MNIFAPLTRMSGWNLQIGDIGRGGGRWAARTFVEGEGGGDLEHLATNKANLYLERCQNQNKLIFLYKRKQSCQMHEFK